MKKSRAIEILNKQVEKLSEANYEIDHKWTIQTQDYITHFFGTDSPQFKYIIDFKFYGYLELRATEEDIENDKKNQIKDVIRFIHDCIEIIENKGTINQNHNFLEKINNKTLITIILFLISGLLYVGYLFGTSTTDSKNVELRQENKHLKDSLSVRSTLDITNKKTK